MASHATKHHKLHGYVGWGLIIGLLPAIFSAACAVLLGSSDAPSDGLMGWMRNPVQALGFLAFFTAAIWYCKLEFDEVVMDYFDGGLKSFSLLANRLVAFIIWLLAAFAVIKLAFLG